jgi:site-specific DNA-methyltransferase (adenine-specific)/adenine-specific DNA-methyltransferase
VFAFPKPSDFIRILIEQITEKDSLVLDSFAGSGTTGQAVISQNLLDNGNRKFILVEMEELIARNIAQKRIEMISETQKGFRFCELGPTLFDAFGQIRPEVSFTDLARHVFFTETGQPLPASASENSLLGIYNGLAVYLLYNGVLHDAGNVLTQQLIELLPSYDGPKVIYADGCKIGRERLRELQITFKQIPYEIKVR